MLRLKSWLSRCGQTLPGWGGGRGVKKGQSLTEYGLILALVTVFCLASLRLLGQNMGTMFNGLAQSISQVLGG